MTRTPALLVLDSCEHLLEACSTLVAQLIRRCPDARIITTSRQPLGLPGEVRFRIDPFGLDDAVQLRSSNGAPKTMRPGGQCDSTSPDVALVRTVICRRRIDGLPLGVELAAMRLQNLNLYQLAEHSATLPHQTALYDRIAWSFQLLDDDERRFLSRLSILSGSIVSTRTHARAIAGRHDVRSARGQLRTADALGRQALLVQVVDPRRAVSYSRLLLAIAEYVRPRLAEFDAVGEIRAQTARHYAGVVAALHASLRINARHDTLSRYVMVAENVDAVLDWSLGGEDVETGAAIAADLAPYWLETGRLSEARRRLDCAMAFAGKLSRRRIVDVLDAAVDVAVARGDAHAVGELADRLRSETGSTTNRAEIARVELADALAMTLAGRHDEAASSYLEALSGFRAVGETRSIAHTLVSIAGVALDRDGDLPRARSLLSEALELARLTGPPSLTLDVVGRLAEIIAQAEAETEAAELIRDVGAHFSEVGDEASLAGTTFLLARHELTLDPIVARMHARDALERLRDNAHPGRLATCFDFLAGLYGSDGDDGTAVRLLAFAAGLRRSYGIAATPQEQAERTAVFTALERRIDHERFERAVREGRTMDLDTAIKRALGGDQLPAADMLPV